MSNRAWVISISAVMLIGAAVAAFVLLGGGTSPGANSTKDADIDTVLTNVLNSHTRWATVQGEAEIIWYGPQVDEQRYVVRFAIAQPASARFETVEPPVESPAGLWISDGENIFEVDLNAGTYTTNPLPGFVLDLGVLPTTLADVESDTLYSHPFSLVIPSPVSEYIFPHWFAQGRPDAVYRISGQEEVIQRKTWLVDYTDDLQNRQLVWIDQQTGMILKYLRETDKQKAVEFSMLSLVVDSPLDPKQFVVPAEIAE